ncbi:MAG: hypothetical protein JXA87_00080 [Thermoleophilia bacterium]|nr:hypothetical protein [Thermoleophilia bacterium]
MARAIDVVAALAVFALFLTPVIAAHGYDAPAASPLKVLAWVYLGVFAILAVAWVFGKRRRREYITIGMSIMELRPARPGQVTRLVHVPDPPRVGGVVSGRLAAIVGMPLIVAAIGFFVYELIVYA